jgi:hypothetical protein
MDQRPCSLCETEAVSDLEQLSPTCDGAKSPAHVRHCIAGCVRAAGAGVSYAACAGLSLSGPAPVTDNFVKTCATRHAFVTRHEHVQFFDMKV